MSKKYRIILNKDGLYGCQTRSWFLWSSYGQISKFLRFHSSVYSSLSAAEFSLERIKAYEAKAHANKISARVVKYYD